MRLDNLHGFLGVALVASLISGCMRQDDEHGHGDDDHDQAHHEESERGPKGGRLFVGNGVQLELLIEEEDAPPVFVAWLYDEQGVMLPPETATLQATVRRFADRVDTIPFVAMGNHLRGESIVREPHSFKVVLDLVVAGQTHQFEYEQQEFRVELAPAAMQRANITTQTAAPQLIEVRVTTPGEVRLNRETVLIARPRFAGVVTDMRKRLGDAVQAGETLAVIQSNNSLTEYAVTATMDGQIVARSGMVGAAVDNQSVLYTVADLSTVWVDFAIYPQNIGIVQRGQSVHVRAATHQGLEAKGEVAYVGPLIEADTRVSYGRVVLANKDGAWQPGLYVNVTAVVDRAEVPVAVLEAAIVRSKFGPSVFIAEGSTFEVQPVVLGRSDGVHTEVLGGLRAGDAVVVTNAYLLKAELGRGEATHDH